MKINKKEKMETCETLRVTTRNGFWGLNELHDFFVKRLDPFFKGNSDSNLTLDFSSVKVWDISAVLWMIIALDYFTKKGKNQKTNLKIRLRLPEREKSMFGQEGVDFQKSADFLRRWRLDIALQNISNNPSDLLVPEQEGYFKKGPEQFYHEKAPDPNDPLLNELITLRLVTIRNLVDLQSQPEKSISQSLITDCRKTFSHAGVGSVLNNICNIPLEIANQFSEHLLTEGLLNIKEHPKATIGMVSVATMGKSKRLILAMVDNGEPIQKTIYKHYLAWLRQKDPEKAAGLPDAYPEEVPLSSEEKVAILNHATMPGVSRKLMESFALNDNGSKIGMGLTYIRDDTTKSTMFGGHLTIASAGVSIRFEKPSMNSYMDHFENTTDLSVIDYRFPWPGNLLRISVPTKEKDEEQDDIE